MHGAACSSWSTVLSPTGPPPKAAGAPARPPPRSRLPLGLRGLRHARFAGLGVGGHFLAFEGDPFERRLFEALLEDHFALAQPRRAALLAVRTVIHAEGRDPILRSPAVVAR